MSDYATIHHTGRSMFFKDGFVDVESNTMNSVKDPQRYLIMQNDFYHTTNAELKEEANALQIKQQDQENEIDKLEVSQRYLRNELKNFVLLRELEKQKNALWVKKFNCATQLKDSTVFILKYYSCLGVGGFIVQITLDTFIKNTYILLTLQTSLLAVLYCIINFLRIDPVHYIDNAALLDSKIKTFDRSLDDLNVEIREIDASNDFITKYVESL